MPEKRKPRKLLSLVAVVLFCTASGFADPNPKLLSPGACADRLVLEKTKRSLSLFCHGRLLKRYYVALGRNPVGPKLKEGDGKTPEGLYLIDGRNANSRFHMALHISYPNIFDILQAQELGVSPGGGIEIHGMWNGFGWIGSGHRLVDWTKGCIAVTNDEIEELWRTVPDGTVIEIKP